MVKKHEVHPLQNLCLGSLQNLIREKCFHISTIVAKKKTRAGVATVDATESSEGDIVMDDKESVANNFITELKSYVWCRVVWYLYDQVVHHILEGVIEAVEVMKAEWTIDTNMPEFRLKVCAMLKVGEVMHLNHLRSLNVDAMPKMIRPSVLRNLSAFAELRNLNLGSSSGGRQGQMLSTCVLEGLGKMKHLVKFSLKYNCRNDILETLATACKKSLKLLDIEYSTQVTDLSISTILEFSSLEELGISRTNITTEGLAKIIMELQKLRVLPRGDFLCDALEWIDWEVEKSQKRKLNISNFWSSESYYFHTAEQMEHVADLCPLIQNMHFMFEDR